MAWGIGMPAVALFGAETSGRITEVRRQMGDRGEAIPNRYSYVITYEFRLPDGSRAEGITHRIGDYFSPKLIHKSQTVQVRYLPWLPRVSEVDWHWLGVVEYVIVAIVGGVLTFLPWVERYLNKKPNQRSRRKHLPLAEKKSTAR